MRINKIFPVIFFPGLFIAPLVFWPRAAVPYEVPKVWFVLCWIEILGIFGFINFFLTPKRKILDKWLVILVFSFAAIATFTSFLGLDVWKSIAGNYYRGDGLITLYHLVGLFLLVTFYWEKKWAKPISWAISLGSFFSSLLLLFIRDGGSFGNPNFLAGYLAVTLPFPAYLLYRQSRKRVKYFLVLLLVTQIGVILSIRSWGGVLVIILFILGWILFSQKRNRWWILLLALGSLSILGYLYIKQNQDLGFVAEGRERIIKRILLGVGRRPMTGWGWANADYAFEEVAWPIPLAHDVYVDKAHFMLLEVLATTGITGLAIYIGIIARTFFLLVKKIRKDSKDYWSRIVFLVFILYIFHAQTNVISINEEIIFWLILGIVCDMSNKKLDKG